LESGYAEGPYIYTLTTNPLFNDR